ncbi:MAG: hypothetical protein K1W05_02165 [Desulfovibrio sp.]|jgi:hypothetical protein
MMVNRLIFEGPDDKHVVVNLLYNHDLNGERLSESYNIDEKKQLVVKNGIDNLIDTLDEELQATDLCSLGVVLDADTNIDNQWARITRVLGQHGCRDVPAAPSASGTIVTTEDGKKIGIWIMPDNQRTGALEDFVVGMIAAGDELWPKAQADVIAIEEDKRRFRPTYLTKAQVHTWLAWQEEPGTRMGETFKKRYLDPHAPLASTFVSWIKRLLS